MTKLIPIILFSLAFAIAADYSSIIKLDHFQNNYYVYKNKFFVVILALGMAVFVGLRTNYNDTVAYINTYENSMSESLFANIEWLKPGNNPGYILLVRIFRHFNISTQNYLMFYALVTICIFIWFIRKYSDNFWLSVFLFIAMGCYTFTLAALKQTFAIALCLIATDRAIQKKYFHFIIWILLASLFHAYSIIYFVVLFVAFTPWTAKTYYLLIATGIIGTSLQLLLGTVINVTAMLGDEYDIDSFSGEGVNVFRVAVVWAPIILSFVSKKNIQQRKDRKTNIIVNLCMINAMIMFIGLFGTANYFARLANYFLIFQTITLPLLLNAFDTRSKKILTIIIILCYGAYLYYSMGIMYGGFDASFRAISFADYIKQLF